MIIVVWVNNDAFTAHICVFDQNTLKNAPNHDEFFTEKCSLELPKIEARNLMIPWAMYTS